MNALLTIGWAGWLILAVAIVYEFVGLRRLVMMFPEGYRQWMPFAQLGSLAHFAVVVLLHPFGS